MGRLEDYQDRQAADARFADRLERMDRETAGLTADECAEIAKRGGGLYDPPLKTDTPGKREDTTP
jgi:hypothetical protein